MSTSVKEISTLALGLPARSRALLADLLLDSLDEGTAESNEAAWVKLAHQRDKEMATGGVEGKTHEQIIAAAHRKLKCSR
jgi:hypothetical protein